MTRSGWIGIALLLFCSGIFAFLMHWRSGRPQGELDMIDFGEVYYGARCALQHKDPYDASTVLSEFLAEGGSFPADAVSAKASLIDLTDERNLPTSLLVVAPFALLPWTAAKTLWMIFLAGLLALAAFSVLELVGDAAPVISICLVAFILASSEQLILLGNLAGVAVSFCILAVWCFLRDRYIWAGVVLLAISLVIKPHDAGFIWLYFLLAGGVQRKRALQTLAVAGILGLCAAIWIAPASPHWTQELHRKLSLDLIPGGTNDPTLSGATSEGSNQIIDMQAAISVIADNPHVYNPISYLLAGIPILAWVLVVMRKRYSEKGARLALAAISVLTLLPIYHRPYDAKLLLLTIPAFAMLWTERGWMRWLALVMTSAGILASSELSLTWLHELTKNLSISTSTIAGKIRILLLVKPAPLILLAVGCFYLWVYWRHEPEGRDELADADRDLVTQQASEAAS